EDQRGIAHRAGGATLRGGNRRGNCRWCVGLRAHQPSLRPPSKDPWRATPRGAGERSGEQGIAALGAGGAGNVAGGGEERSPPATKYSAAQLPGATRVAAAGRSSPRSRSTTADLQFLIRQSDCAAQVVMRNAKATSHSDKLSR